MQTKIPAQVKQEMINTMGDAFGSLFYSLYNEITWLTFKWVEYQELYGIKESRIDLMNEAAPFLFFTIQDVLWDDLILGISRITDPSKTRSKRNISLMAIPQYLNDFAFKKEIENDLAELQTQTQFCRDLRNRTIAHIDYDFSIQSKDVKPLDPGNRKKVRLAIEKIQSIFNKIESNYLGRTTAFQSVQSHNGALSLLYTLELGLVYQGELFRRIKSGENYERNYQSKV